MNGAPSPWQMGFQDSASPVMESITSLHDLLLVIITGIAIVVFILVSFVIYRFRASKNPTASTVSHHATLEVIWTLVPVVILIAIGIPSVRLLWQLDKPQSPDMTIKAIGHQWYWSYEYPLSKGNKIIKFDSYMIEDKNLKKGQKRLLDVDHPVVVPIDSTVRVLVTSEDVIHSFAVPSLGIKTDAVPGRINETWFRISKPGTYYGQCSELCGSKHGFMPIAIKAVSKQEYQNWLSHQKN